MMCHDMQKLSCVCDGEVQIEMEWTTGLLGDCVGTMVLLVPLVWSLGTMDVLV